MNLTTLRQRLDKGRLIVAVAVLGLVGLVIAGYAEAQGDGRRIVDTGPISEDSPVSVSDEVLEQELPDTAPVYIADGTRSEALRSEVSDVLAKLSEAGALKEGLGLSQAEVGFQHDITLPTGVEAEQVWFALGEKTGLRVVRQQWDEEWAPLKLSSVGAGTRYDTLSDGTEIAIRERSYSIQIVAIKGQTMLNLTVSGPEGGEPPLTLDELRAIAEALTESIPA